MLDLKQIESFYPEFLKPYKRHLLREYLQYKILEIIYDSSFSTRLTFMGGTAIRMLHGNTRFSEDLDFDNSGLERKDFTELSCLIGQRLSLEGYPVETNNVFKKAFRCHIRFPSILHQFGLSRHRGEKLLIEVDSEPQRFKYRPDRVLVNKFDIFLQVLTVPVDLLLAQKILCLFNRPRPMGRDFYDVVFLAAKVSPNLKYLDRKLKIKNRKELKELLIKRCEGLNFKLLAEDVEPFLFNPSDKKRVLFFKDYVKSLAE